MHETRFELAVPSLARKYVGRYTTQALSPGRCIVTDLLPSQPKRDTQIYVWLPYYGSNVDFLVQSQISCLLEDGETLLMAVVLMGPYGQFTRLAESIGVEPIRPFGATRFQDGGRRHLSAGLSTLIVPFRERTT